MFWQLVSVQIKHTQSHLQTSTSTAIYKKINKHKRMSIPLISYNFVVSWEIVALLAGGLNLPIFRILQYCSQEQIELVNSTVTYLKLLLSLSFSYESFPHFLHQTLLFLSFDNNKIMTIVCLVYIYIYREGFFCLNMTSVAFYYCIWTADLPKHTLLSFIFPV